MAFDRDNYKIESPYRYFSNIVYDKDEKKHKTGISYFEEIEQDGGDIFYTIPLTEAHRPDKISQRFYSTPHLSWVICMANGLKDPLKDFYAGRSIVIPDQDYIQGTYLFPLDPLVTQ